MPEESTTGVLSGFQPEAEFAKEIHRTTKTLRRWDKAGLGPPRTKLGRSIFYDLAAARRWLEAGGAGARRTRDKGKNPPGGRGKAV